MTYSLSHLPHPGSLVMASHYMDVRILAEANRKDNWEVSLSNLTIHENEILGNGAFAVVHKATLRGKIPLLVINPRLNLVSEHEQDNGTTEHENDECPIDAELCLRIKDLVSISWQVSDGLAYLSSKNFIHRDVAARNVLLTKHLVAKVSDFGLGRYADSALYTARGGRLPFKSMALEALKYYEFSEKTDVWAFAILLFEIFSLGSVPYPTVQPVDMISYIEQGNRPPQPEKCPNEIFKLMKRCWQADPNDRPTFAEIRGELTILLNIDDESYGYLNLDSDKKSRQIRDMINRQITELHTPDDCESNALEELQDADQSTLLAEIVMGLGLSQREDSTFTEKDAPRIQCPQEDDANQGSEPLFTSIREGLSDGPSILPSNYLLPSYSHLPNTVAFSPRPGCIGNDNPFDLVNNNFSHTVNLKRDHFVLSIEEQIHHKLAEGCSSIR
nr:Tyrosine protein kinase domain containing protein [Haemonchus contortus]